MKQITKHTTDNDNLLFVGTHYDEEYYLEMNRDFKGWSFMGLRPNTEEELRERARDTEPEDMGMNIPDFMSNYFDYDKFANDMEMSWKDRHDVQATRENEDGDTLYLGFGSGQEMKSYFEEYNIKTYEDYCNHFDEIGLTEKEYYKLLKQVGIN